MRSINYSESSRQSRCSNQQHNVTPRAGSPRAPLSLGLPCLQTPAWLRSPRTHLWNWGYAFEQGRLLLTIARGLGSKQALHLMLREQNADDGVGIAGRNGQPPQPTAALLGLIVRAGN